MLQNHWQSAEELVIPTDLLEQSRVEEGEMGSGNGGGDIFISFKGD